MQKNELYEKSINLSSLYCESAEILKVEPNHCARSNLKVSFNTNREYL
jgi:hypothetical protein